MNLKKALSILRLHNYKIAPNENGKGWILNLGGPYSDFKTDREIIKLARCYTSENENNTAQKKPMKYFRHRNNRSKTKEDIKHNRFDNFCKNKLRQDEDPWYWD